MNSLLVSVIGPYKSGKTTLVNKLQQRRGMEGDVSFFSFKYAGKNINLIDTPGDMDAPTLVASVIGISDAIVLCMSPDIGINFQLGELVILATTLGYVLIVVNVYRDYLEIFHAGAFSQRLYAIDELFYVRGRRYVYFRYAKQPLLDAESSC